MWRPSFFANLSSIALNFYLSEWAPQFRIHQTERDSKYTRPIEVQTLLKLWVLPLYYSQSLMRKLLRSTLVFWLLVKKFAGIVIFLMTSITFNMTQISIASFLVLGNSSVVVNCRSVRRLALLTSSIQTRIFFGRPTQSLARLAVIPTITVSGRRMILLSLRVLLVYRFFMLQWLMITKAMLIFFPY